MKHLFNQWAPLLVLSLGWFSTEQLAHAESPEAATTRAEIKKTFGFVPAFIAAVPDAALPGAWQELAGLELNAKTALPGKIKELIGLAVSAQVPCKYCIYSHTEFAKLNGASSVEIGESVAMAALARHWSTIFQGAQLDEASFRKDIQRLIDAASKPAPNSTPAKPLSIVDSPSALADIRQTFGFVPGFIGAVPAETLPGAWLELKDLELSPNTALPGKYKSLISLAVASQIPCRYCVIADTEFAKLDGASERELREAVAMASLVRHWSTLLNGLQVDEAGFRRDTDRLVASAKKSMAMPAAKSSKSDH